ncbi:putative DNA helicase ino80 [Spiromyces aspiralis]|uniref:DNA helicase ino80 n=1 Tax=Spiromyces aspiralis TaxID=68401 RepID=A0ACC1HXH1_9FUNG|nr:putative DNA helicase ino80 [Spiromyces aspiralis]
MSLKALDYPILPLSADHYAGEENDETAMEEAEARGGIEVAEDQVGGTLLSLTRQHTKQAEHPAPHQEPGHPTQPTEEELYHQEVAIQKSLFRQIAVMSVPKAWQHMQTNVPIRNNNAKKVAQLCQRELRRVPGKTSARFTTSTTTGVVKPSKELMNRARRTMREMLVFWKRHEREEREARKRAEKEAAERQRQEEEAREARRQQRKLNFLITQTELYSHFIEGKIGDNMPSTDLVDGMQPDQLAGGEAPSFRDLNFDDDNDEKLNERARLSAQNALAKQQSRIRQFDDQMQRGKGQDGDESSAVNVSDMVDSMNLQNPTTMGSGNEVPQPKMLMCKLKEYQLKGLNWLTNLYEQGINGILADEMGLGKTVQSISLLAYLAETHGIFGPFMVVAPASTLHNWQQEISRFVPEFKVLPYWGTQKDRKILRRSFWNTSQLGRRDSPFHVLVTSYQIVVSDENFLNRVKWQYMVLDEAQAIKSSSSTRWKVLLRYHCRNRLLLTGTPIQNSMQELWALLHFIMPSLFDSHEEFGEWFSRDIEAHAEKRGTLNQHQLRRLQVILKPFMLRRIKKHVQHELADKVEHLVPCELTQRQTIMYRGLLGKISVTELLSRLQSTASGSSAKDLNSDADESLMNLVMQFRKVCNHPELFERAEVESPFASCSFPEIGSFSREGDIVQYHYAARNLISYQMPKLLYREGDLPTISPRKTSCGVMDRLFSIWSTDRTSLLADADEDGMSAKELAVLRLCGYSPSQIETAYYGAIGDVLDQFDSVMWLRSGFWQYTMDHSDDSDFRDSGAWQSRLLVEPLNTNKLSLSNLALSPRLGEMTSITVEGFNSSPCKLLPALYKPSAIAPPIEWVCSDHSFALDEREFLFSHPLRRRICPSLLAQGGCYEERPAQGGGASGIEARRRDLSRPFLTQGSSYIWVPSMEKLIRNSGKMAVLDQLLARLKAGGHRVLIYFQMTRMIDLMEEYLAYRQYSYLRLDGSSKISERRDMVTDWQTRPEIFIFLLSTRAGGLGINLTAADTVIFYDSDWNPTVDQQAMDRAHRMGQTKQVTVYRLITRGTIEERILQRARQKDEIHKIVIAGSDPSTTVTDPSKLGQVGGETRSLSDEGFTNNSMEMKSREIVSLLLDETYAKDDEEWSKLLVESRRGLAAGSGDGGDGSHNGEQSSAPPLDTPVVGAADYIFDEHQKRVALAAAAAKMLATNKGKRKARATTATTSNPSKSRGGSGAETPAKRARTATANGPSGNKKKPSGNAAELAMATAPLSNPSTATPCNPDTVPTTPGGGDNNPPEAAAT